MKNLQANTEVFVIEDNQIKTATLLEYLFYYSKPHIFIAQLTPTYSAVEFQNGKEIYLKTFIEERAPINSAQSFAARTKDAFKKLGVDRKIDVVETWSAVILNNLNRDGQTILYTSPNKEDVENFLTGFLFDYLDKDAPRYYLTRDEAERELAKTK